MNIYICGLIGYRRAKELYKMENELCRRYFPSFFLKQFEELETEHEAACEYINGLKSVNRKISHSLPGADDSDLKLDMSLAFDESFENYLSNEIFKDVIITELGSGGICRGLWNIADELGTGLEIDIMRIPVCQEIVEIMELMSEDPYEADSKGCFLLAVAEELPESALIHNDTMMLTHIGKTTQGKARVLKLPEGERFLTPPERQDKDMKVKYSARLP